MSLVIPKNYKSLLDIRQTEVAIKKVKDFFERDLAIGLNLTRVSAPLFVSPESGLNDNLNGTERPVSFDIYGGEGIVAEIQVNERESSILAGKLEATLFPYTSPENGLRTEIISVRKIPELNEQRIYCYTVKARVLEGGDASLLYGMRGIAKLQGERIPLWYYLFRSLVVYMRWF